MKAQQQLIKKNILVECAFIVVVVFFVFELFEFSCMDIRNKFQFAPLLILITIIIEFLFFDHTHSHFGVIKSKIH